MNIKDSLKYIIDLYSSSCISKITDEEWKCLTKNNSIESNSILKSLNGLKTILENLISKKEELLECTKNYNANNEFIFRSLQMNSQTCSQFICYYTLTNKVLWGFLERIYYYSNELLNYINNFPLKNSFVDENFFFLQNCFLDWHSMIDKIATNIWMLKENKKRYEKAINQHKQHNNKNILNLNSMLSDPKLRMLSFSFFLTKEETKSIKAFQNDLQGNFGDLIIFKLDKDFYNLCRNNFIHNEICYQRKFDELLLPYNPSFFGNYFLIFISFLILSAIQLLSHFYGEVNWY